MDARAAVEAVFRQESGRIVAALIRMSGSFDRAEEAMQEAFASALTSWPASGIPRCLDHGRRSPQADRSNPARKY